VISNGSGVITLTDKETFKEADTQIYITENDTTLAVRVINMTSEICLENKLYNRTLIPLHLKKTVLFDIVNNEREHSIILL